MAAESSGQDRVGWGEQNEYCVHNISLDFVIGRGICLGSWHTKLR